MENNKVKKYELHENDPNIKIGFVIWYPFQFFVYFNVYKHLSHKAEFIIDLGVIFPNRQPDELVDDLIKILKKNNVRFRILRYEDYYLGGYLSSFFSKYEALVGVWMRGCFKLEATNNIKKIHMTYGVGKELTTFDLQKKDFDLILAYGNFDHNFYSTITNSVIVGNPKFDDWFNGNLDLALLKDLNSRLRLGKKTILYLPTHSDLSSINDLAEEIKKISSEYNVIVKLHYLTIREDLDLVYKLKHDDIILFYDDVDLLTLFKVSDIVLSDNSSVIFDALLADKQIVVSDFHTNEYFDTKHSEIKLSRRGVVMPLTYSGSIEQRIKKDGTLCVFKNPIELRKTIEFALIDNPEIKKKRRLLVKELFGFFDDCSGKRSADAIEELLIEKNDFTKPFLYHAIKNYEKKILSSSYKITELKSFIKVGDFAIIPVCVIVIDDSSISLEDKKLSILSILKSVSLIETKVELFFLTKNKESIQGCVNDVNTFLIDYNIIEIDIIGSRFKNIIENSCSEIICLTTTSCVVPGNWLLNFVDTYDKNPDVIAIGGYIRKKEDLSLFDEYEYFLIGRQLGLFMKQKGYMKTLYDVKNLNPLHNPFGDIKNSSFKKFIFTQDITKLERIDNLQMMEVFLRLNAFRKGGVLFKVSAVTDLEILTYTKFKQKNFSKGLSYCFASRFYFQLPRYYASPINSSLRNLVANLLDGHWKIKLSLVIFIAGVFYSLGYYYALILIWSNSLKSKNKI